MRKKTIHDTMRRLILVLIMTAFAFSLCVPFVSAAEASGTCGNGISWELNANGVLKISGYGAMPSYSEAIPAPWHHYREDIRIINVESGITEIGNYAFYDLPSVTLVTLPSSVHTIKHHAFYQCTALKNINFSSGLVTIGESAFERCERLKTFRIPNTVKTIGDKAFYRCYSLVAVTVPSSVIKLGTMIFAYCSGLVSAEIRANVASLPTWMFYDCENLQKVLLSDHISRAGSKAFYLCEKLTHISTIEQNADALLFDIRDTSLPEFDKDHISTIQGPSNEVISSDVEITDEAIISSSTTVTTTNNSSISTSIFKETQYTVENNDFVFGEESISVKIDAVIESKDGWMELVDEIKTGEQQTENKTSIQVEVLLNTENTISSDTLNALSGKNVQITVDSNDGSTVQIDCERLNKLDDEKITEVTTLTYQLSQNTNPTKNHIKTIGEAESFLLSFDGSTNFDFSPKIYIGKNYARQTATLYQYVPGRGLSLLQSVKVDKSGYATYYLQSTKDTTQYLIALNVKDVDESTAIIPEDIAADYGDMMYYESIQYVTTGVRLFMGLSLFQFGIAVFCVMLFLFVAVGVVMSILYRKKKLELYYQRLKEQNG